MQAQAAYTTAAQAVTDQARDGQGAADMSPPHSMWGNERETLRNHAALNGANA